MDTTKSTARPAALYPSEERRALVRPAGIENSTPRKTNPTMSFSTKPIPVETRADAAKRVTTLPRENRVSTGPRPAEAASRRVISDASSQTSSTPRRAQVSNTPSEPFLGLSARKRPAHAAPPQSAVARSKQVAGTRRTDTSQASSAAHASATVASRARAGLDNQSRVPAESISTSILRDLVDGREGFGPLVNGSTNILPSLPKDAAIRAAQLSSVSATSTAATPLTIRTRRQQRYASIVPDILDEPQRKHSQTNLTLATSAAKDSIANAERRAVQNKSPPAIAPRKSMTLDNPYRIVNGSPFFEQPYVNGSLTLRNNADHASSSATTPQYPQRNKTLSPDPPRTPQTETALRTSSNFKPVLVDVTSPITAKRQSAALPHNGGLLARAVSPTDIRRTKRAPDEVPALPVTHGSPTSDGVGRNWLSMASPPISRRKSSSPSSPRASPDPKLGFSANLSLSSQSSYNSLRPSSATPQSRSTANVPVSRNSSTRSRTTINSDGDASEFVPPVPAIPKAYGSSRNVSEETSVSNFDDAVLHTIPTAQDYATATTDSYDAPPASASSQDARQWRGLTLGGGWEGSNSHFTEGITARQSTHALKLPPLNLVPLSQPIAAKIDGMQTRQQDDQPGTATPPGARKNNRTPSTPMTASRATFSINDMRFGHDLGSLTAVRNRGAFRTPLAASPAASSPTVFLTPSPAASPAPASETASTPLPSLPDAEEQETREQKRIEMLASRRRLEDARSPEILGQQSIPEGKVAIVKPLSALRDSSTTTSSSPGHRNFSQKLQQLRDEISLQTQESTSPPAQSAASVRRAVSLNPMKQLQVDNDNVATGLLPAVDIEGERAKLQAKLASLSSRQTMTALPKVNPSTEPATPARSTTSQKALSPRASRTNLKSQEGDALFDVDAFAADEEMRKLATSRKEFETAAKELDELKRRTHAREKLSPTQALRSENLNIFERGEIIDYKEIYFCGSKNAKKHVGDLTSQASNFGFDDERGDYNLVIGDHLAYRYEVLNILGKGSFGQVVRCIDHKTGGLVAVKIIRNKKRFHQQALVEVNILRQLKEWDPNARHSMINFTQSFYFRGHLCISTELLGMNLYEFIKAYDFRGFSLRLIRRFTKQMLGSLCLLQVHKVIHCDLKPENILLAHPLRSEIKVIDFGSSCFETEKVYTYIQSRFYRSPEVILGMDYGMPIDMWSFGCILAELYTGYPIFPGENEQEQLACIMEIFGPPEKHLIENCSRKKLFFDSMNKPRPTVSSKGKRRRPSSKTLSTALKCDDEAFLDFLTRCLRWDPARRLKPDEALKHAFIVGRKKTTTTPVLRTGSTASPAKRYTIQTPAKIKPVPEAPAAQSNNLTSSSRNSPIRTAQPLRRHSTVSGLPPNLTTKNSRVSSGSTMGSALPRAVTKATPVRSDAASAAALASIRQR